MFRLSLIIGIFLLTLPLYGTDRPNTNTSSEKVASKHSAITTSQSTIINHKMIEKFKNAEYNSNQKTINDMLNTSSFEQIKEIARKSLKNELIEDNSAVDAPIKQSPIIYASNED
jgi:hypothetical protein